MEVNMATAVIMPRQGQSVESCIIAKWYKQKGDPVKAGDILFTYETDKATFDEEAKVEGTLLDIFFSEGDDVPVLLNVCVIGAPGESTAEFNPAGSTAPAEASKDEPAAKPAFETPAAASVVFQAETPAQGTEIKISPRAKNLAEKAGVDYRYAAASGPNGRIIERDIVALRETGPFVTASAKNEYLGLEHSVTGSGMGGRVTTSDLSKSPAAAEPVQPQSAASVEATGSMYDEVKLPNIRKVIAKAMLNSITTTCQLTLNSSFDATDILEYRKKLKDNKDRLGLENITLNDIILYAVSRTLLNHKDLNANFMEDRMLYYRNVNLGVAVDTERGLMVPNIFNANLKSLNDISKETKKLAQECQKGTVNPDVMKNGSFTVTNLGTLDIESFTPILNAPQTGILGVGTLVQRAREVDGEYQFYPAMTLSLTFNHQALDGAPAAKFLQELKRNLENFSILLAK